MIALSLLPAVLALTISSTTTTATATKRPPRQNDFDWFFSPPGPSDWAVHLGFGTQLWEQAASDAIPSSIYRLAVRRFVTDWLSAGLVSDFTRQARSSGGLRSVGTQTLIAASVAAEVWVSRFRFQLTADAGGLIRTSSLEDGRGVEEGTTRLYGALGLVGSAGIAIRKRAVFSLEGGARHHPGRTHALLLLGLDVLF